MLKKFSTYNNSSVTETAPSILEQRLPETKLESLLSKDSNISMLNDFSKNYTNFTENVNKIDYFSEQLEFLAKTTENTVKREELEQVLTTHLILVNESIQEIKHNLSGINQKDLSKLTEYILI
jgi:hypothetical protein